MPLFGIVWYTEFAVANSGIWVSNAHVNCNRKSVALLSRSVLVFSPNWMDRTSGFNEFLVREGRSEWGSVLMPGLQFGWSTGTADGVDLCEQSMTVDQLQTLLGDRCLVWRQAAT